MLHATLVIMPAACQGTPVCLQVLLLAFLEQGLTSITASAVQLITTTPASQGYMMSQGMVSLHHTATSAPALLTLTPCALPVVVHRHCLLISCRRAAACLAASAQDRPRVQCCC